jgi:3-oxoacyl-[acyl-carrier protein] reductase
LKVSLCRIVGRGKGFDELELSSVSSLPFLPSFLTSSPHYNTIFEHTHVSSIAGHTGGGGGTLPYAAAKGGVNALTRGLARELAPWGIRVNAVAPGIVDTPMQRQFTSPEDLQGWAEKIPLRRLGIPEDIVGAILFLASPFAAYITGEIIEVNGGLLMR